MAFNPNLRQSQKATDTDLSSIATSGAADSFQASILSGYESSVGYIPNTIGNWLGGTLDKKNGLKPVTREDVKVYQDQGIDVEYEDDMYPTQLKLKADARARTSLIQSQINEKYQALNFVGEMIPEVIAPENYLPLGAALKPFKFGKRGTYFSPKDVAINQGKKYRAAFETMSEFTKLSLYENTMFEPLRASDAEYRGVGYRPIDSVSNILLGTAIGVGTFGSVASYINFGRANKTVKEIQLYEDTHAFMNSGNFVSAANVLYQQSPKFRAQVGKVDSLAKFVEESIEKDGDFRVFAGLDAEQSKAVQDMVEVYYTKGLQSALTRVMTNRVIDQVKKNPDEEINIMSQNFKDQYLRVYEALNTDRLDTLSPEELTIAKEVIGESPDLEYRESRVAETDLDRAQATERFSTLLERIKTEKHQTRGDDAFKEFAEAAKSGFLIHEGEKIPVSEETLDRVAQVYENNLDAWKNAPDESKDYDAYLEFLKSTKGTDILNDIYKDTIGQARATSRGLGQITSASDGKLLPQLTFKWSGNLKVGDVYENIDLCSVTSGRCSFDLKMSGLPSTFVSIGQLDTTGVTKKLGSHKVAVTEVDGKRYIVDHPQKELWEPLNPPKADAGRVIATEFKPRFIEVTPENLKKYYGNDKSSDIDRLLNAKLTESTVKSQPQPTRAPQVFTSSRYSKNGYEVSSSGDSRFSAFKARLKDGRTVEQAYQKAKGSGKGQPAKDPNFDYYGTYLKLWKQWAEENPDLIEDLRQKAQGKVLTDKFARTENNQARALADILNEAQAPQVKGFVNHSGGARGSDSAWGRIGNEYGVQSNHYFVEGNKTPEGNVSITREQALQADEALNEANKTLGRTFPTRNEYVNNLLRRNYSQVLNSDAVFAVTEIEGDIPQGGTGWAVQMAVDMGKPVYVYSQSKNSWMTLKDGKWVVTETPTLTKNFAGIGTRDLTEAGKQAIRDVYKKTFESGAPEAQPTRQVLYNKDSVIAKQEAIVLAKDIKNLLTQFDVNTLDEAVELGYITSNQRRRLLKKFDEAYKTAYRQELELVDTVMRNIFGVQPKYEKGAKFFGAKKTRIGAYFPARGTMGLQRAELILGRDMSAFSTLFHEMGHFLEDADNSTYVELATLIFNNRPLYDRMIKYKEEIGYTKETAANEPVSMVFEWAITQKEFWRELRKSNKPLFEKLKEAINEIFRELKRKFEGNKLYQDVFKDIDTLLTDGMTPEEFATRIAQIINRGREKRLASNEVLEATKSSRESLEQLIHSEFDVPEADTKVEPDYFGLDVKESAINEKLGRFGYRSFESKMKRIFGVKGSVVEEFLDVAMTSVDELAKDVDPDAPEFISFGEYRARMLEKLGKENKDVIEDSVFVEMYEVLKRFHANKTNTDKNMNDNKLYRILKRRADSKNFDSPEELEADRQATIRNYYKEQQITLVSNALKRHALMQTRTDAKSVAGALRGLRTLLDGQNRKGYSGQAGLENRMLAASQEAVVPLLDVIYRHQLNDLFLPESGPQFMRSYDPNVTEEFAMFGANRKEMTQEFHRQLHAALVARKLPDNWKGNEGLEELFGVLMATEQKLLIDLNEAGLNIKQLDDFGGISQKWDEQIIYTMGLARFKAKMRKVIDVNATREAHAGILFIDGKEKPFDLDTFIEQWYESLDPNRKVEDDIQKFDLEQSFGGRMVRIKPRFATEVMLEFSGYDNVGFLLIQQLQRRAALAEMASFAGTKPNELLRSLVDGIEGSGRTKAEVKFFNDTVNSLTGILDNPVDATINSFSNIIERLSDILFLSGSGISSLTDVPMIASTLQIQGISMGIVDKDFLGAYAEGIQRRFKNDPNGMRQFLLGQGAGLDAINNGVIRRLTDTQVGATNLLGKLHNLVFKINGLSALTSMHQEMYLDLYTQGLAAELKQKGGPNADVVNNLKDFGFDDAEIKALRKYIEKSPDGIERIVPTAIKNKKLANKYRQYLTKYTREAVFMPDVGTRAQLTGGFRKGTYAGAAMRNATKYMPFMLGMTKQLVRRYANGSFGQKTDYAHLYKMAHLMSYLGGALAFAYMATVLKDIAKGKKPMSLLNMSSYQWQRIVAQSGILGILEVPMDAVKYGPADAFAPMPSTLLGLGVDTVTGDAKGAFEGVQDLTGENIYGPPQWIHGMISDSFTAHLAKIQADMLEEETF